MKSIRYTSLALLLTLLSLPHVCIAQSSEGPVVLTIEEFNNASKQKQQEVINNPNHFIVVKDGQKVDVWNGKVGQGSSELEDDGMSRSKLIEMERQAQQKAEAEQRMAEQKQETLEKEKERWFMSEEEQVQSKDAAQVPGANRQNSDKWDDASQERTPKQSLERGVGSNSQPVPSDVDLLGDGVTPEGKVTPMSDQASPVGEGANPSDQGKK